MNVKSRLLALKLLDRQEKNPALAKELGIRVIVKKQKEK